MHAIQRKALVYISIKSHIRLSTRSTNLIFGGWAGSQIVRNVMTHVEDLWHDPTEEALWLLRMSAFRWIWRARNYCRQRWAHLEVLIKIGSVCAPISHCCQRVRFGGNIEKLGFVRIRNISTEIYCRPTCLKIYVARTISRLSWNNGNMRSAKRKPTHEIFVLHYHWFDRVSTEKGRALLLIPVYPFTSIHVINDNDDSFVFTPQHVAEMNVDDVV